MTTQLIQPELAGSNELRKFKQVSKLLLTTTVGSFPKPDYLKKARTDFRAKRINSKRLEEFEQKATRDWIRVQEEIGLDILVDGEMYRGDMATYFAEEYAGFKISGLVRSYGNRYYRKPIVVRKIRRTKPVTLKWFQFAQDLTDKPIKGMLTGPYTMMDWSFDEYYGSRKKCALALAEVINREAKDLEKAGAKYIQIDEPAISTRPEELDLAIAALKIASSGLKAKTITHICYGRFELIYPKMLKLPVDQIDLEMSNSGYDMLALFQKDPFTKEIGLGVLDVHSHKIETKEAVKSRIKAAMEVMPLEKIYVDPDCGLKTRSQEETVVKLKVMVQAVEEIREELASKNA